MAALAMFALAITPAAADDDDAVHIGSHFATDVTAGSATLVAEVSESGSSQARFRFEYGIEEYTERTADIPVIRDGKQAVTVTGLAPGTIYHFKVVAWNEDDRDVSGAAKFTTAAAPPAAPAPVTVAPIGAAPAPAPASQPELGRSAVVAPVEGTVKVRVPGTRGYTELGAGSTVPVGTVVDTRKGVVELTSAVSGGRTQTGQFGDGLFQVKQSRRSRGLTDIVLRGGDFSACRSSSRGRAAAVTAKRRKPPRRRLWAKDKGGRFRTHGRNSVATVRGTRWVTTDTCAGTRTTVTEGSVAVRDLRRKKTVVIRKGKSYLARGRR
jgi:hypothetical protein